MTLTIREIPREDMTITQLPDGKHVAICRHISLLPGERIGSRHYIKVALTDLPNDLASIDDLERFGIGAVQN